MAQIRSFGAVAHLRSEASSYVLHYRNGRIARRGRGLAFWLVPRRASLVEIPMADREAALFIKGRSQDFQSIAAQGVVSWRVVDPELLSQRVDFSLSLRTGRPIGEPIQQIEARLRAVVGEIVLAYFADAPIRTLLNVGLEPLRRRLAEALGATTALSAAGLEIAALSFTNLAPSSELERALQTPTFEALQQKADEATFERRALAVEKERAIAENELATRIELARREKQLIAEESDNAQARASGLATAGEIEAVAEASRIRAIETAKAEAETAHAAVYQTMPPAVLFGLAAREFAGKLTTIEHLNVSPDLLANFLQEVRRSIEPPHPRA